MQFPEQIITEISQQMLNHTQVRIHNIAEQSTEQEMIYHVSIYTYFPKIDQICLIVKFVLIKMPCNSTETYHHQFGYMLFFSTLKTNHHTPLWIRSEVNVSHLGNSEQ